MKTCTNCRKTKPITDFNKNRGSRRNQCKDCRKAKGHFKKKRFKDGHYSVYYLPEHHYVGMTNSIRSRMQEHRSKHKRITDGYEIIGTYERAVDAHVTEAILHSMGYYGFHYKHSKKNI